ncbi:MAG: hypothetical protein IJI71_06235 [Clostridia bacterium]|nr:hypothetical protein [Clostridia bacterium]
MKKTFLTVLALLLVGTTALAGAPKMSAGLFDSAKQALVALASGDYDALSDRLPFSGGAPDARQWQSLAERYADLSSVQTDYAVGFWTGSIWVIAVPVQPPSDGSVEVLAFSSEDGATFKACRYATWKQIESACGESSRVIWNQEYVGGSATVVADLGNQD